MPHGINGENGNGEVLTADIKNRSFTLRSPHVLNFLYMVLVLVMGGYIVQMKLEPMHAAHAEIFHEHKVLEQQIGRLTESLQRIADRLDRGH